MHNLRFSSLLKWRQRRKPQNPSDRKVRIIDKTCMVFSVIMPLTTIPQIHLIYTEKHATGVSLLMWIFYCIGVIPFLFYGILHKERQLIILNTLWLIAQIIVIIGILRYG